MAKRRVNTLSRKKPTRRPKDVCWVSAEGTGTEYDYLTMDVFKQVEVSVKRPHNVHPKKREPRQVLLRLEALELLTSRHACEQHADALGVLGDARVAELLLQSLMSPA